MLCRAGGARPACRRTAGRAGRARRRPRRRGPARWTCASRRCRAPRSGSSTRSGPGSRIEPQACPYSEMVVWDAASRADAPGCAQVLGGRDRRAGPRAHRREPARAVGAVASRRLLRRITLLRTALAELDHGEDATRLTLADGRRLSATLVVGADGGASPTRELAGIERDGRAYSPGGGRRAPARPSSRTRETAWQRFLPQGPIAFLPLRDGRVSIVWTTTPAEAESLAGFAAEEFSARVTEASDRVLGALTLASERARFPLALWHAREYCRPRLALVGDAAHTIHPLAGQGVNLGLLDCACLVEVLSGAVAAGEDWTGLRVLRRYERWRRSENALMMGMADGLNRLFGADECRGRVVRRLGMGMRGAAALAAPRPDRARARRARRRAATGCAASRHEPCPTQLFTQAPPRLGNQYRDDPPARFVAAPHAAAHAAARVRDRARGARRRGGRTLYRLQLADRLNEPRAHAVGRLGQPHRRDRGHAAVARGRAPHASSTGWSRPPTSGATARYARIEQFAKVYLFHPSTDVYTCPLAMTDGAARTLLAQRQHAPDRARGAAADLARPGAVLDQRPVDDREHRRLRRRPLADTRRAGRRRLAAVRPQVVHLGRDARRWR